MDIISHTLWSVAAYKTLNNKAKRPRFHLGWAAFWGVFPDLFAFSVPFLWLGWNFLTGGLSRSMLPTPGVHEPAQLSSLPVFQLAQKLYNVSHSAVVFFVVFLLAYAIFKKPVWEMGGWLGHILIDVPTHSYRFYPTPVFWPISTAKLNGISWAQPWFLLLNYSALAVVLLVLYRYHAKTTSRR